MKKFKHEVEKLSQHYDKIFQDEKNRLGRGDDKDQFQFLYNLFPNKSKILDIGCGFGSPAIKHFYKLNYDITFTDISQYALDLVLKEMPLAKISREDSAELNFDDNTFDLITSFYSMPHLSLDDQKKTIFKSYSILKDNGVVYMVFGSKEFTNHDRYEGTINLEGIELPFNHFTNEEYINLFKSAGYSTVEGTVNTTLANNDRGNLLYLTLFWILSRK